MEEIPELYESAVREAVTRVRPRRVLRREVPRPAAPRRDPVPGRPARQRRGRLHPRLLAAAPPPEAGRGGARAVPHRRPDRRASTSPPRRSCARRATSAPAPASSSSARTAPSPSSRSTPASRSSTASPRRSPASTWCARCSGSPPARSSATTTPRSAATRSSSGSTPRTAAATSCRPPAPSRAWSPPQGPGVRLDGGYENGETVPGSFDSLIAKLIVTGRDRTQALERSRRALAEFVVDGMPTVIPFHRAVVDDPAYVGASNPTGEGSFDVYTTVDRDRLRQPDHAVRRRRGRGRDEPGERQTVVVEVGGTPARGRACPAAWAASAGGRAGGAKKPKRAAGKKAGAAASGDAVDQPDAGHDRQGRRRGGPGRSPRAT